MNSATPSPVPATSPLQEDQDVRRPARWWAAPLLLPVLAAGVSAAVVTARPADAASGCTVAAAGDIAGKDDYKTGAQRSGDLIRRQDPAKVIALGDLAYDAGTASEFRKYYDPTWGDLGRKTLAVAGNHEYRTRGAAGMVARFGPASITNRGVDVCGWRVVLVNQYRGISTGASFIAAERRAHPGVPMIVAWHEPRYSSGSEHGNNPGVDRLFDAAVAAGARIVLNAHDHHYERFAPMDTSGRASATGTRQFVSGLGGHHVRGYGTVRANSEKRVTGTPAVLFLTLTPDGGYTWAARTAGGAVADSGTQPPARRTPVDPGARTPLSYSRSSDRTHARPVPTDGSLVVRGDAYFFTPATATSKTVFRVDGRRPVVESLPPFDAATTVSTSPYRARPLDTTELTDGGHTLVADSVRPDLPATAYTFTVDNVR